MLPYRHYTTANSESFPSLLIVLAMGGAIGMSLAACGTPTPAPPQPTQKPSETPVPALPAKPEAPGADSNPGSSPTTGHAPSASPSPTCTGTPTPTPSPTPTPTPGTIDEDLALYDVRFTGLTNQWTVARKTVVRNAVVAIANRIGSGPAGFRAVYNGIDFEWCETRTIGCVSKPNFGWGAGDHLIKFCDLYGNEEKDTRLIIHELGHLFDRAVCAKRLPQGRCYDERGNDLILSDTTSSARNDLRDRWNDAYCGKYLCLGRDTHEGPERSYWGFVGGWDEWQFGKAGAFPGEVWADLFLAWVFDKWGNDPYGFAEHKRDYMELHMPSYLNELR